MPQALAAPVVLAEVGANNLAVVDWTQRESVEVRGWEPGLVWAEQKGCSWPALGDCIRHRVVPARPLVGVVL